jgi:uncharacterized repeat protein (TIGR01451 family)
MTPTTTATPSPSATITATPAATATVTETPTPGQPQLQISKSSNSTLTPGGTIIFRLDFANVGSGTATGVVVIETVPDHTRFNAGSSSAAWSCPDLSPPTTICTHAWPDLPPDAQGTLFFAVTADNPLGTTAIRNSVRIIDEEGGSADGGDTLSVPAPAPALSVLALIGALAALGGVAAYRLRRRR